jgi:SPP1 gp7 family putative phage head morphogenesis protein
MTKDFIPKSALNYVKKAASTISKSLVGSLVKKYSSEINDGLISGLSSKQIADNLRKKDSTIKSKTIANTISRTLLHFSYSMGAITDMLEDEMIVAFRFNAVNDSRVSDICESLDGKIISKDEVYNFLPPLHYNCRSVLEPIFINENIPPDKLINKDTYKTKEYQEKIEPLMKKQESFLKYQREDIELMQEEIKQEVKEPEVSKVDKRVEEVKDLISKKINTADDAIKIGQKIDDIIKDVFSDNPQISKAKDTIKTLKAKDKDLRTELNNVIKDIKKEFDAQAANYYKQLSRISTQLIYEKNADERIKIIAEKDKLTEDLKDLTKMYNAKIDIKKQEYNAIDKAAQKEIADSYKLILDNHFPLLKEALKDFVDFGDNNGKIKQKFSTTSTAKNIKLFNESSKYIPTRLLELSSIFPLTIQQKKGRANYLSNTINFDASDSGATATIIHEFAHRIEDLSKNFRKLEKEYYDKRTVGDKLKGMQTVKGYENYKGEFAKKDKWLNLYMGKDYGGSAFEIISMALPSIILNIDEWDIDTLDPETRHFVLGLIVGADL